MAQTVRNPENVAVFADHEVFVSLNPDAKVGRDGTFGPDWFSLGIETDDAKAEITRNVEEQEITGNGFGVIETRYKPGKIEGKVTVIEDNEIIRKIMFPDTVEDEHGVHIMRHTGRVLELVYAVVYLQEDGGKKIIVSRKPARAKCPTIGHGDTPEGREITFTFYPDSTKSVFEFYILKGDGTMAEIDVSSIRFVDSVPENSTETFKFSVKGATGGTYAVTAGPFTTAALAHNAEATAVQAALRAAGDKDIEVTGDVASGFSVTKANGPVKVDASGLTGGGWPKKATVTTA